MTLDVLAGQRERELNQIVKKIREMEKGLRNFDKFMEKVQIYTMIGDKHIKDFGKTDSLTKYREIVKKELDKYMEEIKYEKDFF